MRIRAVRVREVGIFEEAVAVDGFSGRLDVLLGPNETGKSTLLRALDRLFFTKHTATGKEVEALRSTAGGAPLVEADFEAEGKLWRLRKQFLSGRSAELRDAATGRTVARGADAHEAALELIGLTKDQAGDRGRFGLLWIEQRRGLDPVAPTESEAALLQSSIESEVAALASGGPARALRARIAEELAQLVTAARNQPVGAYKEALAARDAVRRSLAEADDRARLAHTRLERLATLSQRREALSATELVSKRDAALTAARQRREAARESRERLALARERARALKSEHAAAAEAAARLETALARLQAGAAELVELRSAAEAAATHVVASRGAASEALASLRRAQAEHTRALDALEAHRRREEQRVTAGQLVALERRQQSCEAATSELEAATAALARLTATPALLAKAEEEHRAILALEARLSAAAPKVEIAHVPGGIGRLCVDGKPLTSDALLRPTRPLVIDIDGIGRITIMPGASEGLAEHEADLAAHRSELANVLSRMGAADLPAARDLVEDRRALEGRARAAQAQLSASAPEGRAALDQAIAALRARVGAAEPAGQAVRGLSNGEPTLIMSIPVDGEGVGLEARLEASTRQLDALSQASEAAAGAAQACEVVAAEARSRLASAEEHQRTALAALPPVSERAALRERLAAAAADAEAAYNASVREGLAWRDAAPDDQAYREIELDVARLDRETAGAAAEAQRLEREIAQVEGELGRDRDEDVIERRATLAEELELCERRVARLEDDVAALRLLATTLDEEVAARQGRVLEPVMARIEPYLRMVLPGGTLRLGAGLAPSGLDRHQRAFGLNQLSEGTREQIGVIARLGFARLFAEQGRGAPLILDDALVYADDRRIESLFEALREASKLHQVIVLTCRERTFESLGGTRLALAPWREA